MTKADPARSAFIVIPAMVAEACNQHDVGLTVPPIAVRGKRPVLPIMIDRPPRVNPAGPKILRAPNPRTPDHCPSHPPRVAGFVRVPHDVTASGQLSDRAFRAW